MTSNDLKLTVEAEKKIRDLSDQVKQLEAKIEEMERNHAIQITKVYSYGR